MGVVRDEDPMLKLPFRDLVVDGRLLIWGAAGEEAWDRSRVRSEATGGSGVCQLSIQGR